MGEGSGAAPLTGNVNGNDEQILSSHGATRSTRAAPLSTPMNVASKEKTWRNDDMGEGSGATLTGDVNGNGQTDIIQPRDNKDNLGMTVYSQQVYQYQKA